MSTNIPQTTYTDLGKIAQDLVSAHAAVSEGIATHAQKQAAAKDAKRRQAEAERKLTASTQVKGV